MATQSQKIEQSKLEDLLGRIVLKDQNAFKQFYDLTSPKVYGLVLFMIKNAEPSKDLMQEIYMRVWSKAGEYDAHKGAVMPWLLTLARYRVLDLLRAQKRFNNALDRHSEQMELAQQVHDNDMPDTLKECLNSLADSQRHSILQAFLFGLTHEELAQKLAIPLGTIKSRIRRGLVRLKQCLDHPSQTV